MFLFNPLISVTMKKLLMSLTIVAAMIAVSSCACNNNSKKAEACDACCEKTECCETKCDSAKCAGCDKAAECEKACCDSTATDCCKAE